MRIKLALLLPFTSSKFILPVPKTVKTINDLKKHILKSLSAVSQHASKARELVLEIDGFELLTGSAVDVIENEDVVSVRLAPGSSKIKVDPLKNRKRKSVNENNHEGKAKKKKRLSKIQTAPSKSPPIAQIPVQPVLTLQEVPLRQPADVDELSKKKRARSSSAVSSSSASSLSSFSSSSSSSFISSSSSSSAETSSSSSSDSSSSSSTSSASSAPTSKPTNTFPVLQNPLQTQQNVGIPRQGKPSTQNRNARRKLARQYKKLAESQKPTPTQQGSNKLQRGSSRTSESIVEAVTIATPSTIMTTSIGDQQLPIPGSMSNRNKKRGFLNDMKEKRGIKTVFGDNSESALTNTNRNNEKQIKDTSMNIDDLTNQDDNPLPFQDTSFLPYELEEPFPPKSNSNTPRNRQIYAPSQNTDLPNNLFITTRGFSRAPISPRRRQRQKELPNEDVVADILNNEEQAEPANELAMVEEEAMNSKPTEEEIWQKVEQDYEFLSILKVNGISEMKKGDLLTCKELELDMTTFSPELVTKIAKITEINTDDGQLKVEWLKRPIVTKEDYNQDGYGEPIEEVEEEEVKEAVLNKGELDMGKWRIVK
ncbi:uncharacterized protein L201_002216 [Kwoniella dendrophila CBS 6074]|uniref:Coilin n=1 Tax=Kwoniella dendrophila CBS 6074 TaxID=1295534 RepID=A0AAX4JRM8_9TREE